MVNRYKGRVYGWDMVNEAMDTEIRLSIGHRHGIASVV